MDRSFISPGAQCYHSQGCARLQLDPTLICANQDSDGVNRIVHRWFARDEDDPWNVVVQDVTKEVKALGLEQNCVGISMYEGHADQLAAHWKHFQDNEPALYSALLKNCTQAFTSRRIMTD